MPPNDHLLKNFCEKAETLVQAQALLRLAQTKTGPGSGHELGAHTTGLAAICSYIASQRLNNGDVTRSAAQKSSCLKPSDFEKVLNIIETAVVEPTRHGRRGASITYEDIMERYEIPMAGRLLPWMNRVEQALVQSGGRYDPERSDIKCAVFFWTCSAVKGKDIFPQETFLEENGIRSYTFGNLLRALKNACSTLRPQLLEDMKPRHSPSKTTTKATRSLSKSPSKTALRALPSKDSPQKRKVSFSQAEIEGDGDNDMAMDSFMPETPTKRRKLDSPSKSTLSSPTKTNSLQPTPSSSRVTSEGQGEHPPYLSSACPSTPRRSQRHSHLQSHPSLLKMHQEVVDTMDIDTDAAAPASSSSEDEDEIVAPRRFRPVFLDHKQWYGRDPRLDRVWRQGEIHKRSIIEQYGHPFEHYRAIANEGG